MMSKSLAAVAQIIAADLVGLARRAIAETLGKDKSNTRLAESLSAEVDLSGESLVVRLLAENYIDFIEQGRKPRTGKMVPIDELRDWALQNVIDTDNDTLYAISQSIWRDGIAPRPMLAKLDGYIDQAFDNHWADLLFDALIEDMTNYFNQ